LNLILLDPGDMNGSNRAMLTGSRAQHVIEVLKAATGQTVRIGMLDGAVGAATVTAIGDRSVSLQCVFDAIPPRPRVDLLLALPRPKVLRRLWAQLAALGVGQIILTNAERVERNYFDTHVLTESFYRPLLIEGLQQARDTWLPRVSLHKRFRVLIEDDLPSLFLDGRRVVAHPGGGNADAGLARTHSSERVLVGVGPEGGWNGFELKMLEAHGFQRFDMGVRTLRTDTACIALLALIHNALRAAPQPEGTLNTQHSRNPQSP
jgi:16S rRNA (uracil1498-N3)-methyltransferase